VLWLVASTTNAKLTVFGDTTKPVIDVRIIAALACICILALYADVGIT